MKGVFFLKNCVTRWTNEGGSSWRSVEEVVQPVLYMHCSKMSGRVYVLIKSGWKSRRGGGGA